MVRATNIGFGFPGQTRSGYLEMSSLSEKLQEQWEETDMEMEMDLQGEERKERRRRLPTT